VIRKCLVSRIPHFVNYHLREATRCKQFTDESGYPSRSTSTGPEIVAVFLRMVSNHLNNNAETDINSTMTKTVLLAEDEPNIVESLTFLLERAGFEISVATDGRRALELALENQPDVLVLDLMLPEIDGYEVLRQLRADPKGENLSVLMLTAKGQRIDRETALECGADLFMTKPFANAEITEAVTKLATESRG